MPSSLLAGPERCLEALQCAETIYTVRCKDRQIIDVHLDCHAAAF